MRLPTQRAGLRSLRLAVRPLARRGGALPLTAGNRGVLLLGLAVSSMQLLRAARSLCRHNVLMACALGVA
eukprot:3861338-Alexandrium_andersonii.AAC.1